MPVSVSVPPACFTTAPDPLIALATVNESERLKASMPADAMATPPLPSVPAAPPLPIRSVPAAISVVLVWVLAPVSEVVPLPI